MTSLLCSDHLNQNLLSWRNMQHSFFLNISQVNEKFLSCLVIVDLIQPFHLLLLLLIASVLIHPFCTLPRVLQLGQAMIIENKKTPQLLGCLPYTIIQNHTKSQNKSKIICCNIRCNHHFPDNHQLIQPQHNKTLFLEGCVEKQCFNFFPEY